MTSPLYNWRLLVVSRLYQQISLIFIWTRFNLARELILDQLLITRFHRFFFVASWSDILTTKLRILLLLAHRNLDLHLFEFFLHLFDNVLLVLVSLPDRIQLELRFFLLNS